MITIILSIVSIIFLAIAVYNLWRGGHNMRLVSEINQGLWDKELKDNTFDEVSRWSKKRKTKDKNG